MKKRLGIAFNLKYFFFPQKNHWLKRIFLVFIFILFDYTSTLVFCHSPYEEANIYARAFMESLGIPVGLTLFVILVNLPIYMTLSMDSHVVRLPFKLSVATEILVDAIFAWFLAGMHFIGGTSWFWQSPELERQILGALTYLVLAVVFVKPYNLHHKN